jgi:hypothetical protein
VPSPHRNPLCWEQAAGAFSVRCISTLASVSEGTPAFTTAHIFAARKIGSSIFHCPATELRQLLPPVGIEPKTAGFAMFLELHHVANFLSFLFLSLLAR